MSLPLLHAGKSAPGLSAALDLRFALDKSLTAYRGPTPSFSRASTGTYFNSSGVLTSAAINAPRFNHTYNGTSWVSRGLLVEEQRTNSAQYSEDFGNAYWTKLQVSISANNANAPDGNTTADKVVENTVNAQHTLYNSGFSVTAGTAYTISFFAKAAGRNFIQFPLADVMTGAGSQGRVNFDLSTGAIGQVVGTNLTAEIINVGSGWYRCICKLSSAASTGTGYLQFNLVNSSTATPGQAYLGDGTSGVLVWGIQLEAGSAFATSYIPSLSNASTTRSADVCQITGVDFSNTWNPLEGSAVAEFDIFSSTSNTYIFHAFDASTRIPIGFFNDSSGFEMYTWNSAYQARFLYGSLTANTNHKAAYGYKENDFAGSLNGSATSTDTSGVIPAGSTFLIGNYSGTNFINGHIARLRYYRKRLPNATLQQLST